MTSFWFDLETIPSGYAPAPGCASNHEATKKILLKIEILKKIIIVGK